MNPRHSALILVAIVMIALSLTGMAADQPVGSSSLRVWKDLQNRPLQAQYMGRQGQVVLLRTTAGITHQVPLAKLCAADVAYAQSLPELVVGAAPVAAATITPDMAAERIDRMVEAQLKAKGLKPNPPLTDEQFIRRVHLDIVGRIPKYDETLAFLSDKTRNKRALLIDRLLHDKGHTSHLFNYFSDMLRLKHRVSEYVSGASYVKWVKQSLADNRPYDLMVREMMTANGAVWQTASAGYIMRDPGMMLDNVSLTSQLFLGTDISCAQCHDHPFDDWTQRQFYELAAFFGKTKTQWPGHLIKEVCKANGVSENPQDRAIDEMFQVREYDGVVKEAVKRFINCSNQRVMEDPKAELKLPIDYKYKDGKPGDVIMPKVLFGTQPELTKFDSRRAAFAHWLTADDNPRFAIAIANRLWSRAFGRALVEPVYDLGNLATSQVPGLLEVLAEDMKRMHYDLREFERVLYRTRTYQREATTAALEMGEPYAFQGPVLRRLSAQQLWDSFLTMTLEDPDYYGGKRDYADWEKTFTFDIPMIAGAELNERFNRQEELSARPGGMFGWPAAADSSGRSLYFDESVGVWRLNGDVLIRASDMPQPLGEGHLLRQLGMSDRLLSGSDFTTGSVPIAMAMMNGRGVQVLTRQGSRILNTMDKFKADGPKVETVFLSVLSRKPSPDEMSVAYRSIRRDGVNGFQDVVWALINTREFLFVQ